MPGIASYPLADIWPVILPRIQAIRKRYAKHFDWHENDVYHACSTHTAFIFNSEDDDSFAIVKIKHRTVNGADTTNCTDTTNNADTANADIKILFIWIACGENGKREQNMAFLREIARSVGASRIEWESPRCGFDRMPGVMRGMTRYSAEV